jgi:hypothetical protein
VVRGIKVDPSSKIFTKLVYKKPIKPPKGVPSPKSFNNPYIPSLSKIDKKTMALPPRSSNHVHLWPIHYSVGFLPRSSILVNNVKYNGSRLI